MNLRLRNDVVLVLLPPVTGPPTTDSGLILAHGLTPATTYGRVRQIGPKVHDVQPGDMVAFPASAGEPVQIDGYEHLLIREHAISATIQKHEAV